MKIAIGAAIVASGAMAFPAPASVADTVITGEGRYGPRGYTAEAFRGDFCTTQTCLTLSNRPTDIARQVDLFAGAVGNTAGPVTVMGYSLSAAAVYELVGRWQDEPDTAPDPETTRLVTLGNPRNKFGGSERDEAGATPLPVGQPYEHLDVTLQYDRFADKPTRWGWYSMLNASLAQHLSYDQVDINAPENLVYEDDNTTYMLVPAPVLPMLRWRDWFTSDERMAELDAKYRPLIEKDYDRPDYVEQGPGADWVNETEPPDPEEDGTVESAFDTREAPETVSTRRSLTAISGDTSGAGDESSRESPTFGGSSLDDDRVADAHGVEVPGGVVGAEVDAAVADIGVALRAD